MSPIPPRPPRPPMPPAPLFAMLIASLFARLIERHERPAGLLDHLLHVGVLDDLLVGAPLLRARARSRARARRDHPRDRHPPPVRPLERLLEAVAVLGMV